MFTSVRKRPGQQEHISDEDVLRFADGELERWRAAEIRNHLEKCWECRTRLSDFQNSIVNFVHFHQDQIAKVPPIDGSVVQLKARLRAEGPERKAKPKMEFTLRMFSLGAAAALVAFLAITFRPNFNRTPNSTAHEYPAEPVAMLTPGQTVPVSRQQVCSTDPATISRVPDASLRKQVFEKYGMANAQEKNFEVDFLITPELGGATTVENLWPEPYYDTVWNAHVKDQLEVRLRDLVCSGELDLGTAQKDLASGWVAAYRRYFKSPTPIRNQSPAAFLLAMLNQHSVPVQLEMEKAFPPLS